MIPIEGRGLFQKYIVTRVDGKERPEAEYFVLRVDKDDEHGEACRSAVLHYATRMKDTLPILATELRAWIAETRLDIERNRDP